MSEFPNVGRYMALDPKTNLVHICMAYIQPSSLLIHATWCNVELDANWERVLLPRNLTCLECIAEVPFVARRR